MSGWKSWAIGEVVEADDFQNFVQDQVVQVYPNAAARGSALGTAVADGMVAYTTDNQDLGVYYGGRWGSVSQAMSPNYIINGAFDFWQRGTSFSLSNIFTADRWQRAGSSGTATMTQQAFTPAELETQGFGDATFYWRGDFTTGAQFQGNQIQIEDVRTLAGQTVTLSFFAKGVNPTGNLSIFIDQMFGSGGSAATRSLSVSRVLTSTWTRYSITGVLPSMSGKTIGAGNRLAVVFRQTSVGATPWQLDLWGVQLEAGSAATPFRRNANSIQGELAACQRYYYRATATTITTGYGVGTNTGTVNAVIFLKTPVTMRVSPTSVGFAGLMLTDGVNNYGVSAVAIGDAHPDLTNVNVTASGLTQFRPSYLRANATLTSFVELNAEL